MKINEGTYTSLIKKVSKLYGLTDLSVAENSEAGALLSDAINFFEKTQSAKIKSFTKDIMKEFRTLLKELSDAGLDVNDALQTLWDMKGDDLDSYTITEFILKDQENK